jgi:(E)-4-hydroxy-3-methyl-but-2-enyl pyrophosphate reductase
MKVVVARSAGFCWGVRRALDAVLEAGSRHKGPVQTLGPLIHNPQALDLLQKRGISAVTAPSDARQGTVVIRAHGIPIQDLRDLKERQGRGEFRLVNATCPEVAKVHSRIKKWSPRGYFTVILGSHGHAESIAHRSFAEHGAAIVADMAEARALTDEQLAKVLVVAQTTFTVRDFREITEYLRDRSQDCIIENTVCEDTWNRQEEARQIASSVDAVVVVGGRNSANTRHLVELCQRLGRPVQYVETAADLDLKTYGGVESVGVLAGASTPTWLVEEVVDVLEQHGTRPGLASRTLLDVLGSPLLLAFGAGATSYGIMRWLGLPMSLFRPCPVIATCYVLAMFLVTPYLDPLGLESNPPAKARFLARHRAFLLSLGGLALALALLLAGGMGPLPMVLVSVASLLGLLYKATLHVGRRRFSIRGIPGSKDVLVALALGVVLVALPILFEGMPWGFQAWAAAIFVASLAFARTNIHNLRYMQNDRILGRETLPIVLGRARAKVVMLLVLGVGFLAMATATLLQPRPHRLATLAILAAASAYPALHLWLYHERFSVGRARIQVPLDTSFYLVGLLTLL